MVEIQNELKHHGILGQRWGIKNGPPYPISPSEHSVSEKKAGWRMSLDKDKNVDENKEKTKNKENKAHLNYKKAIKIGVTAVAASLALYGGYRLVKFGKIGQLISAGKSKAGFLVGDATGLKDELPKLPKQESVSEAIKNVNKSEGHRNCAGCAAAVVCRLCGFDVIAKEDVANGKGYPIGSLLDAFGLNLDNPDKRIRNIMPPATMDRIKKQIGKFAEGDTGILQVAMSDEYRKRSGTDTKGHVLNWIIKNGELILMDGQNAIEGSRLEKLLTQCMADDSEAIVARLANTITGFDARVTM